MDLVDEIYSLSKHLPKEELFALSDQLRRCAVSIPSNISEGYGRSSRKELAQFLSIARGSVFELETQVLIGIRQQFFREEQCIHTLSLCNEIGRILTRMTHASDPDSKH
ncbi:MAG: four helix bundle protein [Oscillospiraceae bacterium]|nr:four helix bundle protein [Oscillospiraceae bacterium]